MTDHQSQPAVLSFNRLDVEKRFGFPAGRLLQPGPLLPMVLAAILSVAFYGVLSLWPDIWLTRSLSERGWVPYAIVGCASWAMMIIFVKHRKIAVQRLALQHRVTPTDPEFVLSTHNVHQVLDRLYEIAEDPRDFILLSRIQFALSNIKNMGRVGDVDDILRSRAEHDESAAESSYTVVRGLIWAVPVLGFIGTVIGLSQAIGSFGAVLSDANDLTVLRPALQSVTAGLATAFETTLQALMAAMVIQLLMTMVKRSEERLLDAFVDYCDRQIVVRLRMQAPVEAEHESAIPS